MSKGKKGSKATPEAVSWDEGLLNAAVEEDDWRPHFTYVCPSTPHEDVHIEALTTAIKGGNRRKFTVIDKTVMLQSASEDLKLAQAAASSGGGGKKSKLAAAATPVDRPMFVEVCEHVVEATRSGKPVPSPLLARMLKYKVLRQKAADRAEAAKKEAEEIAQKQAVTKGGGEKKGGGKGKGGPANKAGGGKKGKETPATEVAPAIPLPEKPLVSMRKRGEEDLDSKYIDDEPPDGPSRFFILTGFTSLEFLQHLPTVGLTAHMLVKASGSQPVPFSGDDISDEQKAEVERHASELSQFWGHMGHMVTSTPTGSMLRDMAQLEIEVPQPILPESADERVAYSQSFFNTVAETIYHVLEQYNQYQHYINYLNLRQLPVVSAASEGSKSSIALEQSITDKPARYSTETELRVDTRLYNDLLSIVPQEAMTVPLILHCMEEQVCATLNGSNTIPGVLSQKLHPDVSAEIYERISELSLPTSEKKSLLADQSATEQPNKTTKQTTIIDYWDKVKQSSHYLSDSRQLSIEPCQANTNQRSLFGSILKAPSVSDVENDAYLAELHAIEHYCTSAQVSPRLLTHALIVLSLEYAQLPSASTFPELVRSALKFDHTLSISVRQKPPSTVESETVVSYSDRQMSSQGSETSMMEYELDLPPPVTSLTDYNVCEPMSKKSLLQMLQSLQLSHPHLTVYNHKLSQSTVIVVHSGFDGKPMHTYSWSFQAHSKVGFNNYLQYVAQIFGSDIDKAIDDDNMRKEAFEKEKQRLIEEKKNEIQQQHASIDEECEEPKVSAQGNKRGSTVRNTPLTDKGSGKKSKLDTSLTPPGSTLDITVGAELPAFEERKIFEAYDVGDSPLLNKGSVTVQFIGDGSQVRTERIEAVNSDMTISVSLLSNGHMVACDMIRQGEETEGSSVCDVEKSKNNETDAESKPETAMTVIPQPPPGIKFASLRAKFQDSLNVSVSHFGPKGNGELPFKPLKPEVLLEPVRPDSTAESRPQSRQTPQKLSKKQLEQQQQFLEQQRQIEEQRECEKREAHEKYHAQYTALLRQNKYQQLFASTTYGLHIHCRVIVDLNADESLSDGSDGSVVVKQSYPIKSQGVQESEATLVRTAYNEKERYCLSDGTVVCFMQNGSTSILCADGHVYQTATKALSEQYHQHVKDHAARVEDKERTEIVQNTLSATRVTFADQSDETTGLNYDLEAVWVITTPTGERYLWKHQHSSQTNDEADGEVNEDLEKESIEGNPGPCHSSMPREDDNQIVHLSSLKKFQTTDPVTKEVMINREDSVIMLKMPDGSIVTQHADGTRITAVMNNQSVLSEVIAECPGFARVTFTQCCRIEFPDESQITCSSAGGYTIEMKGNYQLEVHPNGQSQCMLQPESSSCTVTLDHTGRNNLLEVTNRVSGTQFSVSQEGNATTSHEESVPAHDAYSPRYFVVPARGFAYQILHQKEMDSFLSSIQDKPYTTVHQAAMPESEGQATTVLEALWQQPPTCLPYKRNNLTPQNLTSSVTQRGHVFVDERTQRKRFGAGVGKALSTKCNQSERAVQQVAMPNTLKCRQFLCFQQVTGTIRHQICGGLAKYLATKVEMQNKADDTLPVDMRDTSERGSAHGLTSQWLAMLSNNALMQKSSEAQQQKQAAISPASSSIQMSKIYIPPETVSVVTQDRKEAEQHKKALQKHTVPPYFESSLGQQSLKSQMNECAQTLAHPKSPPQSSHPVNELSRSSTPSTLNSASITLPPVGAESPLCSEMGDVDVTSLSSLNKVRPAHPTPDHAQGTCTPTNVRPTNPTPLHASRTHSPSSSVISQTGTVEKSTEGTLLSHQEVDTSSLVTDRNVSFSLTPQTVATTVSRAQHEPTSSRDATGISCKTATGFPDSVQESTPGILPNPKLGLIEDPFHRKVHTSSTMTSGQLRGFEVLPKEVDFGVVKEGCTYLQTLTLKNIGIESCRFRIKQPPPSTGIKVVYTPGPIAAGMMRHFDIELFAIAVGVVGRSGTGHIHHDLEITSEANILQIPIHATVLTSCAYESHKATLPQAPGLKVVDRPSSRENITRPVRKQD